MLDEYSRETLQKRSQEVLHALTDDAPSYQSSYLLHSLKCLVSSELNKNIRTKTGTVIDLRSRLNEQ